jgi:predicted AAA+ superfamily ATPase
VVLSGSNANLLSRELGTKLTGRHITRELYPFSYGEFCDYKNVKKINSHCWSI